MNYGWDDFHGVRLRFYLQLGVFMARWRTLGGGILAYSFSISSAFVIQTDYRIQYQFFQLSRKILHGVWTAHHDR